MSEAAPASPRLALICGVGGQNSVYLARFLLGKGSNEIYNLVGQPSLGLSLERAVETIKCIVVVLNLEATRLVDTDNATATRGAKAYDLLRCHSASPF